MGLTNAFLKFCGSSKSFFAEKTILTLGNPALNSYQYLRNHISTELLDRLRQSQPFTQSRVLFCDAYRAKSFLILDISPAESPDYICDLNKPIPPSLDVPQVDIILDLGTAEHIFDNSVFLENVYRQLSANGYYIFNLPANNFLEHGFRQYSPTFFYDLVRANRDSLNLDLLCIHNKAGLCIDVLNSYPTSGCRKQVSLPYTTFTPKNIRYGYRTLFALLNRTTAPVYLLGVIQKKPNASEHLNLSVPQAFYSSSLNQPSKTPLTQWKYCFFSLICKIMRRLLIAAPMPTSTKIQIVTAINRVLEFKTLMFFDPCQ